MNKTALAAFVDSMSKEAAIAPNDNLNMHSLSPIKVKGNEVYNAGRAPEQDVIDKTNKEGGPSLKASRDYAAQVQNSPDVQKARNSGSLINDTAAKLYNWTSNAPEDQKVESVRTKNIKKAYTDEIEGKGLDKLNAKDRAAKLQTAYDAERAGGNLNAMNPSTALNKGPAAVDRGVAEGMKDIQQKTTDEYNKRIGDAVQKWGPWVAGLGLGGLGLYLALNQQGQPAAQQNAAVVPPEDVFKDKNWQSPEAAGEV